jgi:hypothetical protein
MTTAQLRPLALYLLAAAALVVGYVLWAGNGFPLDDSWIHQVYGRNLAESGRWEFVRGVPSAASTSPLYTVLLASGYRLGVPYALWTHGLGVLALAGAAMLAHRLTARLAEGVVRLRWVAAAGGLAVLTAWHLIWAAAAGMETMLMSLWTLALLLAALNFAQGDGQHATQRGALYGLLSALALTTRPEGALLAVLIGVGVLVARPAGLWRWLVGAALVGVMASAPYFWLNWSLTGGLFPNTANAKQAMHAPFATTLSFPQRFWDMLYPLVAGGQVLLVPGVAVWCGVAIARRGRRLLLWLVPLLWAVGLVALYAERLYAPYQHGRYVMPLLPLLIVSGVVGTAWLVERARRTMIARVLARGLAATAALVFVAFVFSGAGVLRADVQVIEQEHVATALWLRDNLPPDQLLGIHDIGAVGYFAPRPLLDVAGLISPEVIPIIHDGDALWALLRARGATHFMGFADQLPTDDPNDPHLCPLYQSDGTMSAALGGPMMRVYRLTWTGTCG